MELLPILSDSDVAAAARLSAEAHAGLRKALPFLPERTASHFIPKLAWIRDKGRLLAMGDGGAIRAFLGGFVIKDFRNAGPGAYGPDWCHGCAEGVDALRAYRDLYRILAPSFIGDGARIHAFSLYGSEKEALEAFSLTGFGRIVLDAARPTEELIRELGKAEPAAGCAIRRAGASDAAALTGLDALLAAHIEASPVLMPRPHGRDEGKWREWFAARDAAAFVAEAADGGLVGFIKAEAPQFDVSNAVHAETTLAIDGMFVAPRARAAGIGRRLLAALAEHARAQGKSMVSVDCETTNPEAYAFWSRHFRPVAWSLERRV